MTQEWCFSLGDIDAVARAWWSCVGARRVFALHGDMGAGKTTLVHALCRAVGVRDAMGSPTFSLVNRYETPDGREILHLDLYRLADADEAREAGIEEDLYSGVICFVEWPTRAPELFPEGSTDLWMEVLPDGRRRLCMTDHR